MQQGISLLLPTPQVQPRSRLRFQRSHFLRALPPSPPVTVQHSRGVVLTQQAAPQAAHGAAPRQYLAPKFSPASRPQVPTHSRVREREEAPTSPSPSRSPLQLTPRLLPSPSRDRLPRFLREPRTQHSPQRRMRMLRAGTRPSLPLPSLQEPHSPPPVHLLTQQQLHH